MHDWSSAISQYTRCHSIHDWHHWAQDTWLFMAGQSRQFSSAPQVFGPRCFTNLAPALQGLALGRDWDYFYGCGWWSGRNCFYLVIWKRRPVQINPNFCLFQTQSAHSYILPEIASCTLTPDVSNKREMSWVTLSDRVELWVHAIGWLSHQRCMMRVLVAFYMWWPSTGQEATWRRKHLFWGLVRVLSIRMGR